MATAPSRPNHLGLNLDTGSAARRPIASSPAVPRPCADTHAAPVAVQPRLLDRLRTEIRTRHCSIRTESAYVDWAKRFIYFHNKRHPQDMAAPEVGAFLSYLATERNVSAATQSQAKSA